MKFKKSRIILISCFLIISFLLSGTAYAQDGQDDNLPNPGMTPDSPFYLFDTMGKKIGLFFTLGPEAKASKALEYAEERLAEVQAMATGNKTKELTRAAGDYDEFLAVVNQKLEEANRQGVSANISERVALAIARHLAVLDRVKERAPEKAKEAIARARDESFNEQKKALLTLARVKPERAIEINAATIENRLNRASVKATENMTADVEEALEDADILTKIEDEISELAQGLGNNTTLEKKLAQCTSNRLEVLARVYEKVPETARPAIEGAMENSVSKYERAVASLKEKNDLGEIPEEAPELQKIKAEVKDRLKLSTSNQAQVSDNNSDNVSAKVRVKTEVLEKERVKESVSNLKP